MAFRFECLGLSGVLSGVFSDCVYWYCLAVLARNTIFGRRAQAALTRLAPYFERDCLRSFTPCVSSEPRTMW